MNGAGAYLGTEINGKWYRRFRERPFFARGSGEWRVEGGRLLFRRYLTKTSIEIPLAEVRQVTISSWHAGKWAVGRRVLQLHWERAGMQLSSGFVLTRSVREAEELGRVLERMTGAGSKSRK